MEIAVEQQATNFRHRRMTIDLYWLRSRQFIARARAMTMTKAFTPAIAKSQT